MKTRNESRLKALFSRTLVMVTASTIVSLQLVTAASGGGNSCSGAEWNIQQGSGSTPYIDCEGDVPDLPCTVDHVFPNGRRVWVTWCCPWACECNGFLTDITEHTANAHAECK